MQNFSESKHGYSKEEVDAFLKKTAFDYEQRLADQKERIFELVEENRKLGEELAVYRKKDDEISKALVSAVQKGREIEEAAQKRYDLEIQRLKQFHNKWVRYYREIAEHYPMDSELMSVENFLNEMTRILDKENEGISSLHTGNVRDEEFAAGRESFQRQYEQESRRIAAIPVERILSNNSSEQRFRNLMATHGGAEDAATRMDRRLEDMEPFRPMERIGAYISSTVKAKPAVSDTGFDLNEVLNPGQKLDLGELCKELGLMEEN